MAPAEKSPDLQPHLEPLGVDETEFIVAPRPATLRQMVRAARQAQADAVLRNFLRSVSGNSRICLFAQFVAMSQHCTMNSAHAEEKHFGAVCIPASPLKAANTLYLRLY